MKKILLILFVTVSMISFSRDFYGSIAINQQTGNYGYSYDYYDRYSAERSAVNQCGYDCIAVVYFYNTCTLVAWSPSTKAYGWYSSRNRSLNNRSAVNYCGSYDCRVIVDMCTSWYY